MRLDGEIKSNDMKNAEEEFAIQLTLGCRGNSRTTDGDVGGRREVRQDPGSSRWGAHNGAYLYFN